MRQVPSAVPSVTQSHQRATATIDDRRPESDRLKLELFMLGLMRLSGPFTSEVEATSDDRSLLMRGLVHGGVLSLVIWGAAFYLAFTLR